MPRSRLIRSGGIAVFLLSTMLSAAPASAAQDRRHDPYAETRRTAFAGAAFRIDLGRRASPPAARLQLGLRSLTGAPHSGAPPRVAHVPVVELGLAERDQPSLFIAGQPAKAFERKLGVDARTQNTVLVVGTVALLVVGLLVITNLDGLDIDDND